jgi:hypothetical protein
MQMHFPGHRQSWTDLDSVNDDSMKEKYLQNVVRKSSRNASDFDRQAESDSGNDTHYTIDEKFWNASLDRVLTALASKIESFWGRIGAYR